MKKRKITAVLLAAIMLFAITMPVLAMEDDDDGYPPLNGYVVEDNGVYVEEFSGDPINCTGGTWEIIGWVTERVYGALLPCGNREMFYVTFPIWGFIPCPCPNCNPPW